MKFQVKHLEKLKKCFIKTSINIYEIFEKFYEKLKTLKIKNLICENLR